MDREDTSEHDAIEMETDLMSIMCDSPCTAAATSIDWGLYVNNNFHTHLDITGLGCSCELSDRVIISMTKAFTEYFFGADITVDEEKLTTDLDSWRRRHRCRHQQG